MDLIIKPQSNVGQCPYLRQPLTPGRMIETMEIAVHVGVVSDITLNPYTLDTVTRSL